MHAVPAVFVANQPRKYRDAIVQELIERLGVDSTAGMFHNAKVQFSQRHLITKKR